MAALSGLVALLLVTGTACGADSARPAGEESISITPTKIAGANYVAPARDVDSSCLAPAPVEDAVDPARIAVTDPRLLDDICALGLQSKVVAVVAKPGAIPTYLGRSVSSLPTIGSPADAIRAAAARPDVVVGDEGAASPFGSARTVSVDPNASWQDRFRAVAEGLGRRGAADQLLADFTAKAKSIGKGIDATHSQASLVRFGTDSETLMGTSSFAGQILALMGVQRPATQRAPGDAVVTPDTFDGADADIIYIAFDSPAGEKHGTSVMRSDRWLDMGAPSWQRTFVVDDPIWFTASGPTAARWVMLDVQQSLNGFSG
ncbi:iron complex transport system substrate-binding protein [Williamsia sterculiae]|uniref:Iron complex transport system substrate-binding protein n=2 Tax=Williamsia sterculiae TaxID=1344003 RepID=A0A1N7FQA4_9NOCA|nr:iron complex transport system substrate-binding protein [Williamsia sterculiae]